MTATPFHVRVRAGFIEQTERTRRSSQADIERLIKESELKIISLDELRDRERACFAALKFLIPPIRTLPVELLAEIFGVAIHDDTHIHDAFRISFRVDLPSINSDELYADGLKDWLARSSPLPVPITWCGQEIISCHSSEEVLRIAPRWRSLGFGFTAPRFLVSRLAECQLESLEALALTIPPHPDPSPVLAFTVPRLRKLSLCIRSDELPILSLPWAQLADFTFTSHRAWSHPDIAFDLLAQCSNLVRASVFTGLGLPEPHEMPSPSATCAICPSATPGQQDMQQDTGASFLDNLSAPVLEELCLGFGKLSAGSARWTEAHFPAFQLQVPNITGLELQYSMITSDELKDALSHTPYLERLTLKHCGCCFDDPLIDALHYKDPLVPPSTHDYLAMVDRH
ncbi:hypothetical protein B0H14DRAFT_3862828 [Mycena olivaceomarginata]|nr:hypothetical protein B0H14DRAFT_3862828 [Mycena olivaceomarginata]